MLEDLQNHLERVVHELNKRPRPEFEGYSPAEMHAILHFTFEEISPISFQKLDAADHKNIPLLSQIKYLANLIKEAGEIKLTNLGFLPTDLVADIYAQGFIKDRYVERRKVKQLKEGDVPSITLSKILLTISGLVKKRSNKLSLTKQGQETLQNDDVLVQLIIKTYGSKFNWAYFDGYGENGIGQIGFGFSLVLLSRYGHEWQRDRFYAKKYFKAFPDLLSAAESRYGDVIVECEDCYSYRFFENFLTYFGLVDIKSEGEILRKNLSVIKTDLFDKLIKIEWPNR